MKPDCQNSSRPIHDNLRRAVLLYARWHNENGCNGGAGYWDGSNPKVSANRINSPISPAKKIHMKNSRGALPPYRLKTRFLRGPRSMLPISMTPEGRNSAGPRPCNADRNPAPARSEQIPLQETTCRRISILQCKPGSLHIYQLADRMGGGTKQERQRMQPGAMLGRRVGC